MNCDMISFCLYSVYIKYAFNVNTTTRCQFTVIEKVGQVLFEITKTVELSRETTIVVSELCQALERIRHYAYTHILPLYSKK